MPMESSMPEKIYFCNFRTKMYGAPLPDKLHNLMAKAGFETLDLRDKFVAIKMHFGELGNLAFLRPNYAKVVADFVKQRGGKPFLTDCNTLYPGYRKNALEHLETADLNGFGPLTTGCHVIIGDGLKGNDEVELPVPNGVHFKTAKIGRAISDADVIITLNHFKGHELTGMGGAIKNLAMGCASRAGKMAMHSDGKAELDRDLCIGCKMCFKQCANNALHFDAAAKKMSLDREACAGCGRCLSVCPVDAIHASMAKSTEPLDEKMAEYAAAVVNGKPSFHISLICDVSPNCDCHSENDAPIIPDIGMLAGFDPVALDVACCDLCNKMPRMQGSWMDDCEHGHDVFDDAHGNTRWRVTVDHAVKIGFGTDQYELIDLDK